MKYLYSVMIISKVFCIQCFLSVERFFKTTDTVFRNFENCKVPQLNYTCKVHKLTVCDTLLNFCCTILSKFFSIFVHSKHLFTYWGFFFLIVMTLVIQYNYITKLYLLQWFHNLQRRAVTNYSYVQQKLLQWYYSVVVILKLYYDSLPSLIDIWHQCCIASFL